MTALRELVGLWDDRIKKAIADADATGSNAIKRIYRAQQYFTEDCRNELSAALSAQEERVCGNCTYQHGDICGKVSIPGHSVAIVTCEQIGNTCGAFVAKKEGLR